MRNDLNLTDTEVGGIASASYWVAVISVLPIGRLADNTSRRDVIACALCIWAFGTVLTGFAGSFTSICLSRTSPANERTDDHAQFHRQKLVDTVRSELMKWCEQA
jgi:predicted MFS family arabinose efflux permease